MFKYGMFNYKYPVEVPWCGDGVCTLYERDSGNCPDCTPTVGDGVCDPFLNCILIPELPAWECDTDCNPCDDGDACTQTDTLFNGICIGLNPVKCPVDACHDAAGCDPATGQCSNPPKPDGTPCPGGACQVGICTPNGGSGGPTVTSSSSSGSGSSGAGGAGGTAGNDVGGNGAITSSSSNGGPPDDSNGCSCKTTGGSSSGAAAWLALGLLAVVRRRQNDSRAISWR